VWMVVIVWSAAKKQAEYERMMTAKRYLKRGIVCLRKIIEIL
jgi:hypothetical protein